MPQLQLVCRRAWTVQRSVVAMICLAASISVCRAGEGQPDAPLSYSLAADFSLEEQTAWSFRLIDAAKSRDVWPLLRARHRTANEVWGSDFATSPRMLSDAAGYWGIGRNNTGRELISSLNETRWLPGEVLLHPKGGESPTGLAICWTAARGGWVDIRYSFGLAAVGSNGIGFRLLSCRPGSDTEVVALPNIGLHIDNTVQGLVVNKGQQLVFELDTCGDPAGDIVKADIRIRSHPAPKRPELSVQPLGGMVTEGSRYTFHTSANSAREIQWQKNGVAIEGATSGTYRLDSVKSGDAGEYSVVVDSIASRPATLRVTEAPPLPERFASKTPRQIFAQTLTEQETQLATDPLMLRFAASREKQASDRYRPAYHFVSPESQLNDPNGLCFWQGRWHLFYQGYPPDEFPAARDIPKRRQHWGHAISEDLVHWRDLPYAIHPGIERMCFSGGTVAEPERVVAFYPGIHAGQMVAVSDDPLLLNWEKLGGGPVAGCPAGDSCIWKEGDRYLGLVSADQLVSSRDLRTWEVHGPFVEENPFPLGDAQACPGFVPIGDKHLLVSFSHVAGGQYLLGNYDVQRHRFRPYAQGRFNHGLVSPGGVHAPCAAADGKGGVINILNINDGKPSPDWDQILSLPQQMTLGKDSQLRLAPVEAVATLRGAPHQVGETILRANHELVLENIKGDSLELDLEIDPGESRWVQLNVLRSPEAQEQTSITFYNFDRNLSIWYHTPGQICLDGTRSSELSDVWLRPPEKALLQRDGGPLRLRVFVDRSVVEVFANEKLYMAMRVYPGRADSVGVSLRAQGQDAILKRLSAWQMKAIWPQ